MTFTQRLDAMRRRFQEAGMTREWRELFTWSRGALAGYTGTIGDIDHVTDLTPDAELTFADEVNAGLHERLSEKKPTAGFYEG